MWENVIGRHVRRCNRNLLIANAAVVAAVALVAAANGRYLAGWFGGPVPIRPERIAALSAAEALHSRFVEFTAGKIVSTGYQAIMVRDGGRQEVKADFMATLVGGRLLIVKTKPGATGTHLQGALVEVPPDVLSGLRAQLPAEERGALLDFMLNTADYREDGWWLVGFGLPVLALCVWNLLKWWRRTNDFALHPIVRQMGGEQVALQYAAELESEMAAPTERHGRGILSRSWIVVPTLFHTGIVRLDWLVWIFKRTTTQSVYFVPVGKTHAAVLRSRTGASIEVITKERGVEELLATVAERVPWVVAGYSAELERAWKKERTAFLAAVDGRRREIAGAAARA